MDSKTLDKVVSQVHRRFPEFAGSRPKVRKQKLAGAKSISAPTTYLLTFHHKASAKTPGGNKTLDRWVRVVISESGRILKVTTSR